MSDAVRFYLDQNVHHSVADPLRRARIDVLTALEAGRCGMDDPDQLAFATTNDRVHGVYTTTDMLNHLEYL